METQVQCSINRKPVITLQESHYMTELMEIFETSHCIPTIKFQQLDASYLLRIAAVDETYYCKFFLKFVG